MTSIIIRRRDQDIGTKENIGRTPKEEGHLPAKKRGLSRHQPH